MTLFFRPTISIPSPCLEFSSFFFFPIPFTSSHFPIRSIHSFIHPFPSRRPPPCACCRRESVEKILLEALRILTNMHFDGVLDVLMGSPVPLTEEISKVWKTSFFARSDDISLFPVLFSDHLGDCSVLFCCFFCCSASWPCSVRRMNSSPRSH